MAARSGRLVRPLLGVTREETAAWCRARGLAWREDATNEGDRYARGRVRGGLVPALRAVHPAAERNVVRTAELLRDEAEVLDVVVDTALDGRDHIAVAHLAALPRALARLVVRRLAETAAGGLCAGRPPAASTTSSRWARARSTWATARGPSSPTGRCAASAHRPPRDALDCVAACATRTSAKSSSSPTSSSSASATSARPSPPSTRTATCCSSACSRAPCSSWPTSCAQISIPCEVDFMAVSSYGSATDSSGVVRILKDLDTPIEGRHVLIVEDIVDSGLTLQYLMRNLGARNPASLEVCALLTKPSRRKVELPIRFTGFEIPDRFAIGYGLDHAERYRNLPYVAALVDAAAGADPAVRPASGSPPPYT